MAVPAQALVESDSKAAYFRVRRPDCGRRSRQGQKNRMGTFDEREKGYEAKFAHDADLEFRVTARRNKLLGLWAAERLGLTDAESEAYAKSVVQADFEETGDEDVIRKLIGDLLKGGVETSDIEIRDMLSKKTAEARTQIEKQG
jgi:hypothetical protein